MIPLMVDKSVCLKHIRHMQQRKYRRTILIIKIRVAANLGVTFPSNDSSRQKIHSVPVTMMRAERRVVAINFRLMMGSSTE